MNDDSPATSSSSSSTSCTPISVSQSMVEETRGKRSANRGRYMNVTKSTKAKQRDCGYMNQNGDGFEFDDSVDYYYANPDDQRLSSSQKIRSNGRRR